MTGRAFFLRVVASTIGLLVALSLGEIVLRVTNLASPLPYLPNPFFGWSHTPNDKYIRRFENYDVEVRINSLGLRDAEYPYSKAADRQRILVLGDSFAEAMQVPVESSFPKLVEQNLNSHQTNNSARLEVLNAGTSGYGTDNELLFLRHEGYKYEPDVVLLTLYVGNDIRNNWYPLENIDAGDFRKPYFVPNGDSLQIKSFPFSEHTSAASRIKVFLNRNIRLYSFLREQRNRLRTRDASGSGENAPAGITLDSFLFQSTYSAEWITAWQVTKGIILELRSEAAKHGAKFLVIIIPTQFQVYEKYWDDRIARTPAMQNMAWDLDKPNNILNSFLVDNSIDHIDLLPEFHRRAATDDQEHYILLDGHWNESGHRIAADTITETLLELLDQN